MSNTKYSELRADYYNSGRLLFLTGNFIGAGIMLGYAIELSFQNGSSSQRCDRAHSGE